MKDESYSAQLPVSECSELLIQRVIGVLKVQSNRNDLNLNSDVANLMTGDLPFLDDDFDSLFNEDPKKSTELTDKKLFRVPLDQKSRFWVTKGDRETEATKEEWFLNWGYEENWFIKNVLKSASSMTLGELLSSQYWKNYIEFVKRLCKRIVFSVALCLDLKIPSQEDIQCLKMKGYARPRMVMAPWAFHMAWEPYTITPLEVKATRTSLVPPKVENLKDPGMLYVAIFGDEMRHAKSSWHRFTNFANDEQNEVKGIESPKQIKIAATKEMGIFCFDNMFPVEQRKLQEIPSEWFDVGGSVEVKWKLHTENVDMKLYKTDTVYQNLVLHSQINATQQDSKNLICTIRSNDGDQISVSLKDWENY